MNNFNAILAIIKKNCLVPGPPCIGCMCHIKRELDSGYHEHIDFYLGFLNDLELIEYDAQLQQITLTETGKSSTALFA